MSVGGFLSNDRDLRRFNESLQTELDAIAAQVERELGIRMIEIPALFRPVDKGGAAPWFPALQNAQVVNGRVLVAEPFGPRVGGVDLFQAAYEKAISETGLMVAWVPGCFALHTRKGAVHCASNRLARPSPGLESW
jgi:protein-arginine deiminase